MANLIPVWFYNDRFRGLYSSVPSNTKCNATHCRTFSTRYSRACAKMSLCLDSRRQYIEQQVWLCSRFSSKSVSWTSVVRMRCSDRRHRRHPDKLKSVAKNAIARRAARSYKIPGFAATRHECRDAYRSWGRVYYGVNNVASIRPARYSDTFSNDTIFIVIMVIIDVLDQKMEKRGSVTMLPLSTGDGTVYVTVVAGASPSGHKNSLSAGCPTKVVEHCPRQHNSVIRIVGFHNGFQDRYRGDSTIFTPWVGRTCAGSFRSGMEAPKSAPQYIRAWACTIACSFRLVQSPGHRRSVSQGGVRTSGSW